MKQVLRGTDKSPHGNTFSIKKHTILGSAPSQKHRRLLYSQQSTGEPISNANHNEINEVNGVNNPYHRSIKLANAFGVPIPSKTLNASKM